MTNRLQTGEQTRENKSSNNKTHHMMLNSLVPVEIQAGRFGSDILLLAENTDLTNRNMKGIIKKRHHMTVTNAFQN